ncbi:sulfatase [Myxococcota bacterium]
MLRVVIPLVALAPALVACAGGSDSVATRFEIRPIEARQPGAPRPLREAWHLAAADVQQRDGLIGVRLGRTRRHARLLQVPVRARAEVPPNVSELRLWLSPPTTIRTPASSCDVVTEVKWSLGPVDVLSGPPKSAKLGGKWRPVRLRASPSEGVSYLDLDVSNPGSCGPHPIFVAVSEAQALDARRRRQRSNVILVVIDTLRRDRMDCGDTSRLRTPHLARHLCGRGLFYANAFSTSSWTYPAVASMLTGLLPREHGASKRGAVHSDLGRHVLTLGELLQWNGYATAGFTPNPYAARGLWRGFDRFEELFPGPGRATHEMRRAEGVVDATTAWLEQEMVEPFFAFLLFIDLHEPVDAVTKLGWTLPECEGIEPVPFGWQGVDKPANPPTGQQVKRMRCRRQLYDAALRYVDVHLGRLLRTLRDLDLDDHTAIVVVSDHGEELWDHAAEQIPGPDQPSLPRKRWGVDHGHTMYVELTHVPLLVTLPEGTLPASSRVSDLVSVEDVFATVLSLADVVGPAASRSRDLTLAREPGVQVGRPWVISESTLYGPDRVAVTTESLRAIQSEPDHVVVFDRINDPGEKKPVPPDHPLAARGEAMVRMAVPVNENR